MSTQEIPCGVENVVFDFGGVLVDWNPRPTLDGLYPDGVVDMFFDRSDEWGFWRYNDLSDLGWSDEKILADYEHTHGPAVAWVYRQYFAHYRQAIQGMIPGMGELIEALKSQGIHVWGLTNSTGKYVDAILDAFEPIRALEGIVISAEERLHKPDPLLFQVMLRRFMIEARSTVFVDDNPSNVKAAQDQGMRAIAFTGADQCRTQLAQYGLIV
ncbi:haloacid dehalogenase [Bombiscardovia apis]|uniref:Haloacid dehalogenase n=1 Tax=Bombiscardovia apis TaxID=2932182 RepID=A0ABN6SIG4_9BIFI|nr:HAD family phosphatase [Bombiscardovia apis]BDR55098.1 haloacid dehalogenase [Bombiscardovia apis]